MERIRCTTCEAFVKSRGQSCRRCQRTAKAAARLAQRAQRALSNLRTVSINEHWKLPKLRRAMETQRRRLGMHRDRWESIVKTIFGTTTGDLIDPRQMFLFDVTEQQCPQTASPSPSLSRSA